MTSGVEIFLVINCIVLGLQLHEEVSRGEHEGPHVALVHHSGDLATGVPVHLAQRNRVRILEGVGVLLQPSPRRCLHRGIGQLLTPEEGLLELRIGNIRVVPQAQLGCNTLLSARYLPLENILMEQCGPH